MRSVKNWNKPIALALAGAIALFSCGCAQANAANSAQPGEDNATATDAEFRDGEPALELPTDFLEPEDFAVADAWESCDDTYLAAVMQKAQNGEPITIACIGGSITQGTIAQGDMDSAVPAATCYADLFFAWWEERFPDCEITTINAGIGGTDSYLGVHRLQEDVLDADPDLVLIEYAVNDGDNNFYKKTYENLLRNVLSSEAAAILLFMSQTNGSNAQATQVPVGFAYKVPMLSYANVIDRLMEEERFTAKNLSGDQVHPSAVGHAICGEILWNYLNQVYAQREELLAEAENPEAVLASLTEENLPSGLTKPVYREAKILDGDDITPKELGSFAPDNGNAQFPNGWTTLEGEGGITFTATFRNLGILYMNQKTGNPGIFTILIDGEPVRNIDADFSGGWGNAITAQEVYTSAEEAEHTITILRAEESEGLEFYLLGLLVS